MTPTRRAPTSVSRTPQERSLTHRLEVKRGGILSDVRWQIVLLCALAFSLGFEDIIDVPIWKPWRVLTVLACAVLVTGRISIPRHELLILSAFALGVVICVVPGVGSTETDYGDMVHQVAVTGINFLVCFAIRQHIRSSREIWAVLSWFAGSMLVTAFVVLLGARLAGGGARLQGFFGNANYAGTGVTLGALILISQAGLALTNGRMGAGLVRLGLAAACCLAGLFTGSRMWVLSVAVGMLVMTICGDKRQLRMRRALMIGLLAMAGLMTLSMGGIMTVFENSSTVARLGRGTEQFGVDPRVALWQGGLAAWRDSGYIGVGMSQYRSLNPLYFREYATVFKHADKELSLHSDWVTMLVEQGPLGLLLFAAGWAIVVRRLVVSSARLKTGAVPSGNRPGQKGRGADRRIADVNGVPGQRRHVSVSEQDLRALILAMLAVLFINSFTHVTTGHPGLWFGFGIAGAFLKVTRSNRAPRAKQLRPAFSRFPTPAPSHGRAL